MAPELLYSTREPSSGLPFLWQVSLVFEHLRDQLVGVVKRVFRRSCPDFRFLHRLAQDITHQGPASEGRVIVSRRGSQAILKKLLGRNRRQNRSRILR